MKLLLTLIFLTTLAIAEKNCTSVKKRNSCFKGRLEIKAACMNYTISVQEGQMDDALLTPEWTNETTGKTYKNVFELASKCNFPDTIQEGQEFYFEIDSSARQECPVCLLYYPVPDKKLSIRVVNQPCP